MRFDWRDIYLVPAPKGNVTEYASIENNMINEIIVYYLERDPAVELFRLKNILQ